MKPYLIHVPEPVLVDLQERLARTRWPSVIPNSGWRYGANVEEVRALCEHWQHTYDWRVHEARLNEVPQRLCSVDGVDIHFFHIRAKAQPCALPLLLLHGWPGSSYEFADLFTPLTDPAAHGGGPAFDLVVPCLPGFGFSGKPLESGWEADRIARAFHTLMTHELGYLLFGIQGGDWGTIIGTRLAVMFPGSVCGLHINMPFANPPDPEDPDLATSQAFMYAETGYLHLQNTKPDALSLAQSDSPAGLAAWVLEKFRAWSDCGGNVFSAFSKEALITNLMFYWATNSIASAARVYAESAQLTPPLFAHAPVIVPTGVAVFPKEPFKAPRAWLEASFNIAHWTDMPRGGHFAALEQPQLLLQDMRRFFSHIAE